MSNLSSSHLTPVATSGSPALAFYEHSVVASQLWNRPELSSRDRSIITVAALISRHQVSVLKSQFQLALDNGVSAAEISEMIAHLAFYAGFGCAPAAAVVAAQVFEQRAIQTSDLPGAKITPLPVDDAAEAQRAEQVSRNFATVSAGLVKFTTDAVFNDLWLRPDLAPRDRSLVTVSALVANSQVAQIPFHLNKAMDNGVTEQQAGEALTQLAFYAGWPNAFSALPVFKQVLESRLS